MNLGLAEILKEASKVQPKAKRIEYLRQNSSPAMKHIVGFCYDPTIEWCIPEGTPPYTPVPKEQDAQNVLKADIRKLHMFVKSVEYPDLPQMQRENQFIQLLEAVDPDDANLLLHIKERKMPYPNLSKLIMKEAFPGIAKNW